MRSEDSTKPDHASTPPASGVRAKSMGARIVVWVLATLLLLTMLFAAAASWLLWTESGARYALSLAQQRLAGTIQIEGVSGTLAGPLQLASVRWNSPDQQITAHQVQLAWRPSALLKRQLHITLLQSARLEIVNSVERKSKAPVLPDSLALPLSLRLDRVQVDTAQLLRGPLPLAEIGGFSFAGGYDGQQYRLQLAPTAIRSTDAALPVLGELNGNVTLQHARPYAVQGQFRISSNASVKDKKFGAQGTATLSGSLQQLHALLDISVAQRQVPAAIKGEFTLQPFSAQVLSATNLTASGVDLSFFIANAPRTQLTASLQADQAGRGKLALKNAAADTLDSGALPLTSLQLQFSQQPDQLLLTDMQAQLGSAQRPAGTLRGNGSFASGALNLALNTQSLDLSRLDRRARKTGLSGRASWHHVEGRDRFSVALSEPLKELRNQRLELDASGMLSDDRVTLDQLRLRLDQGQLQASGHVELSGKQSFALRGELSRFNLQALGQFPSMPPLLLNSSFALDGGRAPRLNGSLVFSIKDSRLADQPLSGDGQLILRNDILEVPRLQLNAGANQLLLDGRLAGINASELAPLAQLRFTLNAPRLEQFGRGLSGALHASGTASGTPSTPAIAATWKAERLGLPDGLRLQSGSGQLALKIDPKQAFHLGSIMADAKITQLSQGSRSAHSLAAKIRFVPQADAPLQIDLQMDDMLDGPRKLHKARVLAQGTTADHSISASLQQSDVQARKASTQSSRPRQASQLNMTARGGLLWQNAGPTWRGMLERLESSGRFNARLTAPAKVQVSRQRQSVDQLRIDGDSVRLTLESLVHDRDGIVTSGQIERLQLGQLLAAGMADGAPLPVATDLELEGEWKLRIQDRITGNASVRRRSGDIKVLGSSQVRLGLRKLEARAQAVGNRIEFSVAADGAQLGEIGFDGALGMQSGQSRLQIAKNAPLSGSARIDMPSISWAGGLLSPSLITEGRVQSAVRLSGSLEDPVLSGQITGSALRLFFTELGVDLRQGQLDSSFEGSRLLVRSLSFTGGDGRLTVSGPLALGGGRIDGVTNNVANGASGNAPSGQLALKAERFRLLNRSDRQLVVSGDSSIRLAAGAARVRGAFKIDAGSFDIGQTDLPQLSEDVVIVGRQKKEATPIAADIDVSIALADGVQLKGRGINARIVGDMRLKSDAGEPLQAQGTLRVAKGSFTAYGRELAIEQGILRFTGALNNPALDVQAMRRNQEVAAGVSVRGTVLVPRITLVSDPVVPDAEKLSWLVLGRGLSASGGDDLAVLQTAAAGLLTGNAAAGVQGQLASAFGLDTVSVSRSQDTLQQRIVTLGKQVSNRLYVSYRQGLETATGALLLRYTLTPRLSVEAEAGTRSVLSLFYNITFD